MSAVSAANKGVALVTALLVVALATLAATALMSTASLAVHRTAALRDSEAAWWVARGVEAWVTGILRDDKDRGYDGLDEAWAQPVEALPIDQGFLRGQLVDLQGRFNLNNLLLPAGSDPRTNKYTQYETHFRRILEGLPGDLQISPMSLIAAIRDWGDADQNLSMPDGAEDGVYAGADPPYRTADRQFTVVSELRAVRGVTPAIYAALKDLVCALPDKQGTAINVNTAPEAVLLAIPGADAAKVHSFVESRKDKPAHNISEIEPSINSTNGPPVDVKSRWFQIQGEVFVGSSRVALYSLIDRSGPTATPIVLAHSADAE